jgi:hypothetical protein
VSASGVRLEQDVLDRFDGIRGDYVVRDPGPHTDRADFAQAFDRAAYVLAALALGTAVLAFRLGRVPAGTAAGHEEDRKGRTVAGR